MQSFLLEERDIFGYELTRGGIVGPLAQGAPIIVSCGMGVDSVAMLVELRRLNIRPDAIITAMVGKPPYGNEHGRFYRYLPILSSWLAENDFPPITEVRYTLTRKAKHFHYVSLAGNCLSNRTLPSISFRRNHSCSVKYKGKKIDQWVRMTYGDRPCYRLVGYDCTEGHRNQRFARTNGRQTARPDDYYIYPLQYLGHDRERCHQIIASAGMPDPGKSSCFFCASMKPDELDSLSPVELWIIVIIEAHASPRLTAIRGLWGHQGSMTDYIKVKRLLPPDLIDEVWAKWSAEERPPELSGDSVADHVLFEEAKKYAARFV